MGRTDVLEHEIDTGDAKPIRQAQRFLPVHHREGIRAQLAELLAMGVIEKSYSSWASSIVPVKKKDGSLRICVDYKDLNKVTKRDAYDSPKADAFLEVLAGKTVFSTFLALCHDRTTLHLVDRLLGCRYHWVSHLVLSD